MEEYDRDAWETLIEKCEEVGVDAFEINFSCPHGMPERKMGMAMGQDCTVLEVPPQSLYTRLLLAKLQMQGNYSSGEVPLGKHTDWEVVPRMQIRLAVLTIDTCSIGEHPKKYRKCVCSKWSSTILLW